MGLKEAFQQYGEVIDGTYLSASIGVKLTDIIGCGFSKSVVMFAVRVITDRESGRSRGFGFVSYTSADAANSALHDMDGKVLLSLF